jgi:hypothetical protein
MLSAAEGADTNPGARSAPRPAAGSAETPGVINAPSNHLIYKGSSRSCRIAYRDARDLNEAPGASFPRGFSLCVTCPKTKRPAGAGAVRRPRRSRNGRLSKRSRVSQNRAAVHEYIPSLAQSVRESLGWRSWQRRSALSSRCFVNISGKLDEAYPVDSGSPIYGVGNALDLPTLFLGLSRFMRSQ